MCTVCEVGTALPGAASHPKWTAASQKHNILLLLQRKASHAHLLSTPLLHTHAYCAPIFCVHTRTHLSAHLLHTPIYRTPASCKYTHLLCTYLLHAHTPTGRPPAHIPAHPPDACAHRHTPTACPPAQTPALYPRSAHTHAQTQLLRPSAHLHTHTCMHSCVYTRAHTYHAHTFYIYLHTY